MRGASRCPTAARVSGGSAGDGGPGDAESLTASIPQKQRSSSSMRRSVRSCLAKLASSNKSKETYMKLVISTILFSAFVLSSAAYGQSFQGSLRGRVLDPNRSRNAKRETDPHQRSDVCSANHRHRRQGRIRFRRRDPRDLHRNGRGRRLQEAGTKRRGRS